MAISYDYIYIYILAYKLYTVSMQLYVNVVSIVYGKFVDL
jgi:hypothetical protein